MVVRRLDEFQSLELFQLREPASNNLISRAPGVYEINTRIQGNSLLSTLYVHSLDAGASVLVEYVESTTGEIQGELFPLTSHPVQTAAGNPPSRILVTRIHNKPVCRATVIGGNASFGVYATVVGSDATDIDSALQLEGAPFAPTTHKGIPIAGVDESGDWKFARFTDTGELKIAGIINADVVNAANDGKIITVNINPNSWTPLPSSPRAGRVSISIQNLSGFPIAINYDTPAGFTGKIYEDGTEIVRDINDELIIYAKASPDITTPTVPVVVEELASV